MNLWHPTAIAGVDVDVDVYAMLETLSSCFTRLETLRLFPSYWQSTVASAGYLHFQQPVSDDQAVRIFAHLRGGSSRGRAGSGGSQLKVLVIANSAADYRSRNEVFSRGSNGEPMRWIVRSLEGTGTASSTSARAGMGAATGLVTGTGKILLTTHEAKKGWHMEQVWEGDRRLTMVTVRHAGVKPHFEEVTRGEGGGDWVLPSYELPFDERAACVAGEAWGNGERVTEGR